MAMALDAMEFSTLHDTKLRKLMKKRKVLVYHGTGVNKLAKILKHGSLDPNVSGQNENKTYSNSSPGIFVTLNPGWTNGAETYVAKNMDESGGDGVLLQLEIPLEWIHTDPDDTRVDELGNINQLGKYQGVVPRPISIKNIREVKFFGSAAGKIFGGLIESDWMTIGNALDKIAQKAKKENLPDEYLNLISGRPKFLKRRPAQIDREQELAQKLGALWGTFNDPYHKDNEKFLLWLLEHNSKLQQKADITLLQCLTDIDPQNGPATFQEILETEDYLPKKTESFLNYLLRLRV